MWSNLLMVLARRDWPSPPISPAVYLTSFGEHRVSRIRQGNNNVELSTYGGVMKEREGRAQECSATAAIRGGGCAVVCVKERGERAPFHQDRQRKLFTVYQETEKQQNSFRARVSFAVPWVLLPP